MRAESTRVGADTVKTQPRGRLTDRRSAETRGPSRVITATHDLLRLQRTAGNQVVAQNLPHLGLAVQRNPVEVESIPRPHTTTGWYDVLNRYATKLNNYSSITFNGPILTIGANHTGDMYDVAIARNILNNACVLIWGVDAKTVKKATEIARFVDNPKRVMYAELHSPEVSYADAKTLRDLVGARAPDGKIWISEGGATTVVVEHAKKRGGKIDVAHLAPAVRLRGATESLDQAMLKDLKDHGFKEGVSYGIVNFRQSGHSGVGNALPLDTGVEGFEQLLLAVEGQKLTPVAMGEKSQQGEGANLVKYWEWPSITQLGRRAEARLLHVMVEKFTIKLAVGMRSGVTDLLNYVGIPTLTIDIHPQRGDVAKGWQRTLKRQHALTSYALVSLLQERIGERVEEKDWPGAILKGDLQAIEQSITELHAGRPVAVQTPDSSLRTIADRAGAIRQRAEEGKNRITRLGIGTGEVQKNVSFADMVSGKKKPKPPSDQEKQEQEKQKESIKSEMKNELPVIDNLLAWLRDPFTQKKAPKVDAACRHLEEAKKIIATL